VTSVVVTGSTRGIGYGLADSFLALGCVVTVSGRTSASVEGAVERLSSRHQANSVLGHPCDVTRFEQVQGLWDRALRQFGKVDIWVNNAGIGHPQLDFWTETPEEIRAVVETNVIGTMYGARVALRGMLEQGFGALYNVEGLGSDDRRVRGLTLYGSTKSCVRYLTDALAEEVRGTGVIVGAFNPGMVVTDFLTGRLDKESEDWERARRIFNILADRVETVTPWLAERAMANTKNGARFNWMTRGKVIGRFLVAPFHKRDLFAGSE
jgi:NAD(P)-dependent dehydrogenase (short-subunit alcohol dehydrogenase family)